MKDLTQLMQQAQAMQQKLQDAQAKMAETTAQGTSGGGLVTIALKGPGEITSVLIDDSLLKPGEGALYDGKGIDSIIALNDVMAIGVMTALRANGIEPGREIGVTGFGDIPYSADVFPPLTTVHLPLAEMGQAAVDSILSNRDDGEATGGTANRLIYVQSAPDVVLRGSLPRR